MHTCAVVNVKKIATLFFLYILLFSNTIHTYIYIHMYMQIHVNYCSTLCLVYALWFVVMTMLHSLLVMSM